MTNDEFQTKVKTDLSAQAQDLDIDTRQRLAAARRKALNQPAKKPWRSYLLPASSLALCGMLAVFILVNPRPNTVPTNVVTNLAIEINDQVATLELLDNTDDMDIATDPDFYLWADEVLAAEDKSDAT